MNNLKKIFYIFFSNFLILIFLIFLIEIFFGYWLKKNNFGFHMRAERNKIAELNVSHHDGKKINFIYRRNFYGFIGDEFVPRDVKIVFEGGSTGVEMWKPIETSIVGVINILFEKDGVKKKIYNASINGKSIRGYTYDFNHWFTKIPEFDPEYVIFYLGINDRKFPDDEEHRFYDEQHSKEIKKKIRDYVKNNSFILEKIKKIKNKYFMKNYFLYDMTKKDLYNNFKYINYEMALKKHSQTLTEEDKNHLFLLNQRLNKLNDVINQSSFKPIFITQIKFDGLAEKRMFLVNEEIKKFAKKNNYILIPLDELIKEMSIGDFFDEVHTTIAGSNKIAKTIYENLVW